LLWEADGAQMLRDLAARGSAYGTGERPWTSTLTSNLNHEPRARTSKPRHTPPGDEGHPADMDMKALEAAETYLDSSDGKDALMAGFLARMQVSSAPLSS